MSELTSVSLRKTLRTIPIFQSLPTWELDAIAACFMCNEYRHGDRLWYVGSPFDFIGVIQKGEIIVEYRTNGSAKRSTRLAAGSFVQPPGLGSEKNVFSVSAYAATEVVLYVLTLEQIRVLRSKCPTLDSILAFARPGRIRCLAWGKLWPAIIAILIALLVWRDLAGGLSGVLYLTSGQLMPYVGYQKSLSLLGYAEWFDPQSTYVYNRKGYIWIQAGNEQSAAAAFTQALNVDDTGGTALNNLATIYLATGLVDQATDLQQRASHADPNIAVVWHNYGLILMGQNDYRNAIRAFKEAARIDPDWVLPYIYLCSVYLQMGDYAQAEQAARLATRLDPTQQPAHLSLAIALYHQHKTQEALLSIERANEMMPEDVVSRFYQALILRELGDHDLALLILQQLLDSSADPEQRGRIAMEIEDILRQPLGTLPHSQYRRERM